MSATQPVQRVVAIRNGSLVALSEAPDGPESLITAATHVLDDPTLTILPAFNDTHNHLLEATRNATFVPVNRAYTIAELLVRTPKAPVPQPRSTTTSACDPAGASS